MPDTTLLWCVQPLPLWQKAGAGLTAGGLGALVGSPADLTLIRMQADATLPLENRRNYKGVGDAMVSQSVDHPRAGNIGFCRAVHNAILWGVGPCGVGPLVGILRRRRTARRVH